MGIVVLVGLMCREIVVGVADDKIPLKGSFVGERAKLCLFFLLILALLV